MADRFIYDRERVWGPLPYENLLAVIRTLADDREIEAYAVGGMVRDALLGRPTTDLDFVTVGAGSGIILAEAVAERLDAGIAHVYENFGTAAVRIDRESSDPLVLEFVAARKESYRQHSRKPRVEEGSLEDDQRRRDFTVNVLALALNGERFGELVDPFGGIGDLRERRLRTPLDPEATFEDDPLRMLRAARFAAQLGFAVEEATYRAMDEKAYRIEIVSQERITEEIQKIVNSSRPSVGFRVLYRTGLLEEVVPELDAMAGVEVVDGRAHKDNFFHTLQVVDNVATMTAHRPVEEVRWLRWAALLHDVAKPETKRYSPDQGWTFHGHEDRGSRMVKKLFRRMKLPLDDRMRYVRKLVELHHRPVALVDENVTDSAVRRLLFEAGDDVDDLMLLVRADITSKNPERVYRYLGHFDRVEEKMHVVEEKDRIRNFQPPIDGNEIMELLDLEPGPAIGEIKDAIKEAILEGTIPNEYDAARTYMMEIKDDLLDRDLVDSAS